MNTLDTFRTIFDQAPVGIAHVTLEGNYLEVNRRLCEITGYSRDELLGSSWKNITHPEDLPANLDMHARFKSDDLDSHAFEKRYIRKDGRVIWVKVSVSPMRDPQHQPIYHIVSIDEITAYKRAQELLRNTEEKCSKAFHQNPAAIMISGVKSHGFLEVNDAFERLTGYSREEVIGRSSLDLNLWVDPVQRDQLIGAALAGDRVEGWEKLYRAKSGRTFTGLTYVDRIEVDGETCLISTVTDISDLKALEAELQQLSGRLIQAQDEERRQMAEELTNSMGQSIAVVSFELAQLAKMAQGDLARGIHSISAKIRDVAAGIGAISQRLHPSGLELTGLPWAVESLCRQFMHQFGLQVAFKHNSIPLSLPPDIALALYRIVQEGLSNVVHHSGERQAWVDLDMNSCSIRLKIWDEGPGFNGETTNGGLGLLTMRERCRRLSGSFAIHTENGTRLEAQIPLPEPDPADTPT